MGIPRLTYGGTSKLVSTALLLKHSCKSLSLSPSLGGEWAGDRFDQYGMEVMPCDLRLHHQTTRSLCYVHGSSCSWSPEAHNQKDCPGSRLGRPLMGAIPAEPSLQPSLPSVSLGPSRPALCQCRIELSPDQFLIHKTMAHTVRLFSATNYWSSVSHNKIPGTPARRYCCVPSIIGARNRGSADSL